MTVLIWTLSGIIAYLLAMCIIQQLTIHHLKRAVRSYEATVAAQKAKINIFSEIAAHYSDHLERDIAQNLSTKAMGGTIAWPQPYYH